MEGNIPFPDDDASSISDYGASYNDNEIAPYLTPLRPVDDKYDVYDLELILDKKVSVFQSTFLCSHLPG